MSFVSRFVWLASPALLCPVAAHTQDIEEIVVTAQKREQRLIDVPLAVSALTAETLQTQGATTIEDVQYTVPGLSLQSYGPGNTLIQMRGIASLAGRPTVANYINEVPINTESSASAADVRLVDLERVEVLRGPQPTLYGEGAMGGTIRYITAAPELNTLSGSLAGAFNSVEDGTEGYAVNGHVNIPLVTDSLGLRLSGGYQDDGGWIDRGSTGQQDVNRLTVGTARAEVLARFGENASLSLLGLYQESDQASQNFGIDRNTGAAFALPLSTDFDFVSATFRYDLGFAELTAVAGYIDFSSASTSDLSPVYVPALTLPPPFGLGLPAGFITQIPLSGTVANEITTGEVRLVSRTDSALSWAIGLNRREVDSNSAAASSTAPGAFPLVILATDLHNNSEMWGLWAELGYRFTGRLQATVGARYFTDDSEGGGEVISFGAPSSTEQSATFETVNPRLNVNYQLADDWLLYFNAGKGFRSGGFNATSSASPTYDPEQLYSYELGSKGSYFDGALLLETDVYWTDWKDVQTNFYTPAGLLITTNGGNVRGWGADLAALWRVTDRLQVGGTVGWNDLEYVDVPRDALGAPSSEKDVGDPPDLTVQESWSLYATYRQPLTTEVTGFVRVDYQHAGANQITLRSPVFDQVVVNDTRDFVNLHIGAEFDKFTVTLFANNVIDEDAPVIQGPFGLIQENVEQRPRSIGVNLRTTF